MIHDCLDSPTTTWLEKRHDVLRQAFDWLRGMPAAVKEGVVELDGPEFFVNVHGYDTEPTEQCRWESHRHTIDIQYCISGGESIDWAPPGSLESQNDYDVDREVEHWRGEPAARLMMVPRRYVLFLPNELHRPRIHDGTSRSVKKLVFKIHARRLGL